MFLNGPPRRPEIDQYAGTAGQPALDNAGSRRRLMAGVLVAISRLSRGPRECRSLEGLLWGGRLERPEGAGARERLHFDRWRASNEARVVQEALRGEAELRA
jgi:hypothetical protein